MGSFPTPHPPQKLPDLAGGLQTFSNSPGMGVETTQSPPLDSPPAKRLFKTPCLQPPCKSSLVWLGGTLSQSGRRFTHPASTKGQTLGHARAQPAPKAGFEVAIKCVPGTPKPPGLVSRLTGLSPLLLGGHVIPSNFSQGDVYQPARPAIPFLW